MIPTGLKIGDLPRVVAGLRDQRGEFRDDVGKCGKDVDLVAPCVEPTGADVGFTGMTEDEPGVGTGAHQLHDFRQLIGDAADLEQQPGDPASAHPGDELGAHTEVRLRLALDQMADAANQWVPAQLGEACRARCGAVHPAVGDDRRDAGAACASSMIQATSARACSSQHPAWMKTMRAGMAGRFTFELRHGVTPCEAGMPCHPGIG
jgi:hypothetical protein